VSEDQKTISINRKRSALMVWKFKSGIKICRQGKKRERRDWDSRAGEGSGTKRQASITEEDWGVTVLRQQRKRKEQGGRDIKDKGLKGTLRAKVLE